MLQIITTLSVLSVCCVLLTVARFLRWYGYRTLVEKSVRNRGQLDSPRDAQNWLKYFHRINARFLDTPDTLVGVSQLASYWCTIVLARA